MPFRITDHEARFTSSALGIELLLDPETLHAVAQRAERNAEKPRRGRAVIARLLQRLEDRLLLDALEILGQRRGRAQSHQVLLRDRLRVLVRAELQILDPDLVPRGE